MKPRSLQPSFARESAGPRLAARAPSTSPSPAAAESPSTPRSMEAPPELSPRRTRPSTEPRNSAVIAWNWRESEEPTWTEMDGDGRGWAGVGEGGRGGAGGEGGG